MRKPGLIISLTYGNVDKELTKEEYESIIALLGPLSFINHLQNNYGPIDDGMFDITTVPHYQFDCFVACSFDISKPIAYDEDRAIAYRGNAVWKRRAIYRRIPWLLGNRVRNKYTYWPKYK